MHTKEVNSMRYQKSGKEYKPKSEGLAYLIKKFQFLVKFITTKPTRSSLQKCSATENEENDDSLEAVEEESVPEQEDIEEEEEEEEERPVEENDEEVEEQVNREMAARIERCDDADDTVSIDLTDVQANDSPQTQTQEKDSEPALSPRSPTPPPKEKSVLCTSGQSSTTTSVTFSNKGSIPSPQEAGPSDNTRNVNRTRPSRRLIASSDESDIEAHSPTLATSVTKQPPKKGLGRNVTSTPPAKKNSCKEDKTSP